MNFESRRHSVGRHDFQGGRKHDYWHSQGDGQPRRGSLAQLGLPVKVVVFNNSALGFIEIVRNPQAFSTSVRSSRTRTLPRWPRPVACGIRIEDPADVEKGIAALANSETAKF
jgi:hypothetical protein